MIYWDDAGRPIKARVYVPPRNVERPPFTKPGEDDVVARARWLASIIKSDSGFAEWVNVTAVIEFPEFQAGAARQMGWKTGSLQRLTFLVGVMAGYLPEDWRIILVSPSGWKGQLPKDVVERRMTRHYGAAVCAALNVKTHAWDALGIGEWAWRQSWMAGACDVCGNYGCQGRCDL